MKKFLATLFLVICMFGVSVTNIFAIEHPSSVKNNIFGIHILDENDFEDAAKLVNSSGGDWGYVTFVIREDERDLKRWQQAFDKMRELHLIPIVRIATRQENSHWKKPVLGEIDSWITFLNSLNWVIKNRYIVIGNEPNHATEWGNSLEPELYGDYLIEFSKKLKSVNQDFFILPAALDASAPNDKTHLSQRSFLERMILKNTNIFDYIDGWNSHSYPNPNFSGSPMDTGQRSIYGYAWELELLKSMGLKKDLPVFITETGWVHNDGSSKIRYQKGFVNPDNISKFFQRAYEDVWLKDHRVVAVTPFILNYRGEPFNIFSWKKEGDGYYGFYETVQKITKVKGIPIQLNLAKNVLTLLPQIIQRNDRMYYLSYVENIGQKIWEKGTPTDVYIGSNKFEIDIVFDKYIIPFKTGVVFLRPEI